MILQRSVMVFYLVLFLDSGVLWSADLFEYKDASGIVHYTNVPTRSRYKRVVDGDGHRVFTNVPSDRGYKRTVDTNGNTLLANIPEGSGYKRVVNVDGKTLISNLPTHNPYKRHIEATGEIKSSNTPTDAVHKRRVTADGKMKENQTKRLPSKRRIGVDGKIVSTNVSGDTAYKRQFDATGKPRASGPRSAPITGEARHGKTFLQEDELPSSKYQAIIEDQAYRQGIDPALVTAMIRAESSFNPLALSPKGAQGLMQLMPETAMQVGVINPFDAKENIRGGTLYLRYLLERFQNQLPLALAAYNAGPSTVSKYGAIPPFPETQNYVQRVMGFFKSYSQPKPRYGVIYQGIDRDGTTFYTNQPEQYPQFFFRSIREE